MTAPDPPDGIWIDATGCAHLFRRRGRPCSATSWRNSPRPGNRRPGRHRRHAGGLPGRSRGTARRRSPSCRPATRLPPLASLPVAALRLTEGTWRPCCAASAWKRISQLTARAPLALRFGPGPDAPASIRPLGPHPRTDQPPPAARDHQQAPRLRRSALYAGTLLRASSRPLVTSICERLERAGQGRAPASTCCSNGVDATRQAIRIGTARPARAPAHLARLLEERIEEVDPGPRGGGRCTWWCRSPEPAPSPPQAGSDLIADNAADIAVPGRPADQSARARGMCFVRRPSRADLAERSFLPD